MDCENINALEDCSCLQCGEEIAKGEAAVQDRMSGTIFCRESHWMAYYDIDGAAAVYKAEMAGGDPIDE